MAGIKTYRYLPSTNFGVFNMKTRPYWCIIWMYVFYVFSFGGTVQIVHLACRLTHTDFKKTTRAPRQNLLKRNKLSIRESIGLATTFKISQFISRWVYSIIQNGYIRGWLVLDIFKHCTHARVCMDNKERCTVWLPLVFTWLINLISSPQSITIIINLHS